jgi:hypothetical protein
MTAHNHAIAIANDNVRAQQSLADDLPPSFPVNSRRPYAIRCLVHARQRMIVASPNGDSASRFTAAGSPESRLANDRSINVFLSHIRLEQAQELE